MNEVILFAARLKLVVIEQGLTLKDFALATGTPYRSMQNYLSGDQAPGLSVLIRIKLVFDIDLNWLLTGSAPDTETPKESLHWHSICIKGTSHGESITASAYVSLSVNQITKFVIEQISIALRIEMSALLSASYLGEMTHDEFAGDEFDGDGHVAPLVSCRQLGNKFKIYQS